MASRSLSDLQPAFGAKARSFQAKCELVGIDVLIYCTLRGFDEQDELYAQGRKTKGKIVTNARGGESFHQYGIALDCVPLVGGKPAWGDTSLYAKIGAIGEECGMVWAGRWTGNLKETAHFQDSNESIASLKAKWPHGWQPK